MSAKRIIALSIGSNVGDREANIKKAVSILEKDLHSRFKKSPVFECPPMYYREQDVFYNCCVSFESSLPALELHKITRSVEKKAGRKKSKIDKGPRVIDIDIIFIGSEIITEEPFTVPHMDMQNRMFVLKPLECIIPDFEHPAMQMTVRELIEECPDGTNLKKVKDFWKKKKGSNK